MPLAAAGRADVNSQKGNVDAEIIRLYFYTIRVVIFLARDLCILPSLYGVTADAVKLNQSYYTLSSKKYFVAWADWYPKAKPIVAKISSSP